MMSQSAAFCRSNAVPIAYAAGRLLQTQGDTGDVAERSTNRLLWRIDDAAERLSMSRAATYRLVDAGEIAAVRIGRARRIPNGALEEFVARREAEAAAV